MVLKEIFNISKIFNSNDTSVEQIGNVFTPTDILLLLK